MAQNVAFDLRYAMRMLRRTPLFTAAAITTLALGTGANTTVFTFFENIVLRSLPAPNPNQLVALNWGGMTNMSYPNYVDFRDRNTTLSDLLACRIRNASISPGPRENYLVWGYEASGNYFQALGITPQLGRFFGPAEDDRPGAHPVLVLSHRYWQTHFAADPRVVGRIVKLNGFPFTIIGVAPAPFAGTELIVTADFWVPLSMAPQIEPGSDWLRARSAQNVWTVCRLKAGVSRARAEADLDRIAQQLARAYPDAVDRKAQFHLSRPGLIGQSLRTPVTSFGVVLMSVAALGLLLACVNLAGMLSARASDRHREIGIRLALGASRFQLLRQLMMESLLLAATGGLLGFGFAVAACRLLTSWRISFDIPISTTLQPDVAVLWFTIAIVLGATFLFGLAPALQASRVDVIPSLSHAPWMNRRRWHVRDLMMPGQIALSVVLVICSVLVVRSLQHALSLNLGFNPENAVSVSFDLQLRHYNEQRSRSFDAELLRRASALPGIDSAAIINAMPLRIGQENNDVITRTDRPVPKFADLRAATVYNISPGYLQTAATRLLYGRDFDSYDRAGAAPVAIVNQALVDALFGKEDALGRSIRLSTDPKDKGLQIVGVVETGKYESLGEDPHPVVFVPIAQTGTEFTTLVARTRLSSEAATNLLRKAILEGDPELTLSDAGSLKDQLALPLFPARMAAIVLGVFGAFAIVLAATGLFASVAYTVSRRTREISIRMALGAQRAQVLLSVLGRTLLLGAIGASLGTALTLAAGKLIAAVLYGISPRDPATYGIVFVLMMVIALAACWNPAWRAIHAHPAQALREQ